MKMKNTKALSLLAVVGLIATAVLAAKETPKYQKLLADTEEEKGEELEIKDKVIIFAKSYAPAIGMGLATALCVVKIEKRQREIIAAYNLLEKNFKRYREKLIELGGEELDNDIRMEVARSNPEFHVIDINSPDEKRTWFDPVSERYFEAYEREVMDAEYHMNRNFVLGQSISLTDYFTFLGLELRGYDDDDHVGWCLNDCMYWIDFYHSERKDGVMVINTYYEPEDISEYL